MNAVIFGAGNIGRGFIGALFSCAGLNVTFIDVQKPIIDRINADGEYPLHIVGENPKTITIKNVRAVDGNDTENAVKALVESDICATCVGAKALKFIIPNLSKGVKERTVRGIKPLNLLICENLMDADKYIASLLQPVLSETEMQNIGLIETSVGRMVPKAKNESGNPLEIAVEEYGILPVDRDAFKGEIPEIENMVPFSPFKFFVDRKLYIHNMGHAVCAYLGMIYGYDFICDSIENPQIRILTQNAMQTSAMSLSKKFSVDSTMLQNHVNDLLYRFGNRALGDTCERVGADVPRKLANADRLIGAALSSTEIAPTYICVGIGAALYNYTKENPLETLCELAGIEKDSQIAKTSMEFYNAFQNKTGLCELVALADKIHHNSQKASV